MKKKYIKFITILAIISHSFNFNCFTMNTMSSEATEYKISQVKKNLTDIEKIKVLMDKLNKTIKFDMYTDNKNEGIFGGSDHDSITSFSFAYKKDTGNIIRFSFFIGVGLNKQKLNEINKSIRSILNIVYKGSYKDVDYWLKKVISNSKKTFRDTTNLEVNEQLSTYRTSLDIIIQYNRGLSSLFFKDFGEY